MARDGQPSPSSRTRTAGRIRGIAAPAGACFTGLRVTAGRDTSLILLWARASVE
jgi:hypothetical protein